MRTIDSLPGKQGRKPLYDWDTLLDGQARVLRQGTKEQVQAGEAEFTAKVTSFVSRANEVASDRGLRFSYRTEGTEDVPLAEGEIAIQALAPATDEDEPEA